MAQLASLLVPIGDLPKPDTSWIGNIAKSLGGALDQASENKSFNTLADRIGGAPTPAQQQGGFLSRLMGGNQQPAPAPQGGRSMAISSIDPSIKNGIVSTAKSLGVDPVDLATAISYETGGTFDPTKTGPTTQWGQHRGLIQFGEPQAQKYGVNWDDPVNSQLGENGAVAKYLRDTGVQPGMSLMDIYSAINAGGVGRNSASDANNGGAPGTVADKVNNQMSGHRQRALALIGSGGQPQAGGNVVASLDPSVGIPMPGATGQMRAGDPSQMAPQSVDMSAQQPSMQQPVPAQAADNGPSMLAQGITPIQRGGVDPEMIQFMLRDPNLRQAGLQLWQQNATGKTSEPWQFVTLPDGTLARANQQTGAVEKLGQFSKPQDPISVSEGETLLDPVTKQPIYQGQSNKPPVIQEFFDDQTGQAYKAEFDPKTREWKRIGGIKAPSGMSIQTNPDGTVSIQQGAAGKPPKLTEAEGKNSGFLLRANTAQKTLNDLESQGTSLWNNTVGQIPKVGNYMRSEEAQKYDQAKRNFINAQLRRESGAVISPEEFANAEQQYFPQPGDGLEVIKQKRKNRDDAIRGLEIGSGAGAALTDPAKPPAQEGNAADLDAARDAIRRSAPRDKVIERHWPPASIRKGSDMAGLSFDDLIPKQTTAEPSAPAVSQIPDDGLQQREPTALFDDLVPPAPKTYNPFKILPLRRDGPGTEGLHFDSDAGILGAYKDASKIVNDTMEGRLDPLSQEGIGRALNAAAVFLPMTPAAGTGKTISALAAERAGPVVKPGMESAVAANRLGVALPRSVASDSAAVQQSGKLLSNVPIGGTPLRTAAGQAIEQLGEAATRTQQGYGPGSIANAGAAARQGITDYAKNTLTGRVENAYNDVDRLVTQNVTTPLVNTAKIATDISGRRANASLPESSAVGFVQKALANREGLNYQGIKDLRTNIGEMLKNPQKIVASGFDEGELKKIYGGLTDDLKSAVARGGGEQALSAFEKANQLAAKTSREREGLQKVLGNDASDERIFDRIASMASSNARGDRVAMARVRSAVSDETWNDLASGVITKLGRDADGKFSPDRFVTGWGKLSPEGKSQLFGGKKELASSLDDIATVSRQFKKLNQYANPSGTGQAVAGLSYISGAFLEPTTVIGTLVGTRVLSNVMAKPVGAKALAEYSKAYERHAVAPTVMSTKALKNTARALSAYVGHEVGDSTIGTQIYPTLSNISKVPADQGGENNGLPEDQNGGPQQQLRPFNPNET